MNRTALTMIALWAGSGVAFAEQVDSHFYTDGFLQYEYNSGSGNTIDFGYGDFSLGLRGEFGGNPAGFDLGVMAIGSHRANFHEAALFPTVWVDTGYGRFSAGVPRSAFASRIAFPPIAGSYYYTDYVRYAFNFTDMAVLQGYHSYGVRYDGSVRGFDVGLSWHHLDTWTGSGSALTGFVGRDYGAFDFAVGFENLHDAGNSETTYAATLGYDVGSYGARLSLGDSFAMPDSAYSVEAFYRPRDWLTLTASYGHYANSAVYGANAEASFLRNGYAGIGYLDGDGFASGVTTAYVGWRLNY